MQADLTFCAGAMGFCRWMENTKIYFGLRIFTVKMLKIQTPEKFAVVILKFEHCGSAIDCCIQKVQTEWQTVYTKIRLLLKQTA